MPKLVAATKSTETTALQVRPAPAGFSQSGPIEDLLHLIYGNNFVQRLLKRSAGSPVVQRQCACSGAGTCEDCTRGENPRIQAKVPVGPVDDAFEREANRVAERVIDTLRYQRFVMILMIAFAIIGVVLAASGVYGVTSYAVVQRTREIGIRMALGAETRDVMRMVLGRGVAVALAGASVGIAASYAMSRYMATLLYGVKSTDAATYAVAGAALIGVAVAACYLPARRATHIDPILALRND